MRISILTVALIAFTALTALPGLADANCGCKSKCGGCHATSKCGGHASKCGGARYAYREHDTAVAGYTATRDDYRDEYVESGMTGTYSGRTLAAVDRERIAEYHSIFGNSPRVAGYTSTWSPWMDEGAWVTVNGKRVWATEDDFVWTGDRWVWADNDTAVFTFEDDRFDTNREDWGIDNDRFDLDVDRDKLDVDSDKFNVDEGMYKIPDKLEIK